MGLVNLIISTRIKVQVVAQNNTLAIEQDFQSDCIIPPESNCWKHSTPISLENYLQVEYNQVGCDNDECKRLVCSCDQYCCETLWDLACRGYPDNRFKPGCSAKLLCCRNRISEKSARCDCYRKRLPIV